MSTIFELAGKALQNRHTTGAAIVYAAAKWGCPLMATWWPAHKSQLEATANILEGAAVFYGFASAGDAGKSVTKEEADTTFLKKSDVQSTLLKP